MRNVIRISSWCSVMDKYCDFVWVITVYVHLCLSYYVCVSMANPCLFCSCRGYSPFSRSNWVYGNCMPAPGCHLLYQIMERHYYLKGSSLIGSNQTKICGGLQSSPLIFTQSETCENRHGHCRVPMRMEPLR